MDIAIDITFLKDQYAGRGIGRYGQNLISKLLTNRTINWHLIGFEDKKSNLKLLGLKEQANINFYSIGNVKKSTVTNHVLFRRRYIPLVKKIKPDIYFAPHFERGLPIGLTKVAVAVHDAVPYFTNSYSQKGPIFNYLKKKFYIKNFETAKKADVIITLSDFSKSELIRAGFEENKVVPIHIGISENFSNYDQELEEKEIKRILMTYRITKPYFLYYGGLEENKNVKTLITSFEKITQRHPDQKLVITGGEFKLGWDNKATPLNKPAEELVELVKKLKIERKVLFTGRIEENHLTTVLKQAMAFVHLSEYEGFGLSVAEAMAIGTPVIAANRSSYPEVLGDSAILVSPKSPNKISHHLNKVITDKELRKELKSKGIERAKRYDWNVTTKRTLLELKKLHEKVTEKIGLVTPYFYPSKGGAELHLESFGSRLVKDNFEVSVFTANLANSPKQEIYKGMNVFRFRPWNNLYYLKFYPGLLGKFLSAELDYVHASGFGFIWQDFCLILKKLTSKKTKFINSPHGPFMSLSSYSPIEKFIKSIFTFVQKLYLNWLYDFVTSGNPEQINWINGIYKIDRSKVIMTGNGIDKEMFEINDAQKVEKKYNLEKKTVITYLGRFNPYKGVSQVIEVLARVRDKYKDVVFLIMGNNGGAEDDYRRLIRENNLEKTVTIIENPDNLERNEILQRSDIFVLPSEWEAFGIVMIEAMAKNNAIISTRTEGGNYLIKEEENGYLFDYGNLDELEEKLTRLLKSKTRIEKIKKNNNKKAHRFTWDELYKDNYLTIFKK